MLDFKKTYELLKKQSYLQNFNLTKDDGKELVIKSMLDYGVFESICEIHVTYYGQVTVVFTLGKFDKKMDNKKYQDLELDYRWAQNRYYDSHNGVFMFTSLMHNGEKYLALRYNDINYIRDNTTPEKVRRVVDIALKWATDSDLSGYITQMGMALNNKKR